MAMLLNLKALVYRMGYTLLLTIYVCLGWLVGS